MSELTLKDRYLGCVIASAKSDFLGSAFEFKSRGSFHCTGPVLDGTGTWHLPPGAYTDDTSMALCLADSLIDCGFDAEDQLDRYCAWHDKGYRSSIGHCFDIGGTCSSALSRYRRDKSLLAPFSEWGAGNGSLMRLTPIPLYYRKYPAVARKKAYLQSRVTHGAIVAADCCVFYTNLILGALNGKSKEEILAPDFECLSSLEGKLSPKVEEIQKGSYQTKKLDEISSDGYSLHSLEAALYCFYHTDNLKDCVLMAVNLGSDTDTVACITGQLAGAYYGIQAVPEEWPLMHLEMFQALTEKLLECSEDLIL